MYLPYIITGSVFSLPLLTGLFSWVCFLAPLPVIYYLTTLGQEQGTRVIVHSVLGAGVLALLTKMIPVLFFSLSVVPAGFLLANSIRRKENQNQAALKAILSVLGVWGCILVVLGAMQHNSLYKEVVDTIDFLFVSAIENYKTSAKLPPETIGEIETAFTTLRQLVAKILPGVLVMMGVGVVWLNMLLGDFLLKKGERTDSPWKDYNQWRLPEQLVWGVIVAALLQFIAEGPLATLGLNVLLLLSMLYFFQGLAILSFLLEKWTVPVPVRFFLYTILAVQAYGILILAVVGLADVWLDIRKPRKIQEE